MIYRLCQFACEPVTETTFRDEVTRCRELWNSCRRKKKTLGRLVEPGGKDVI